MQTLLKCFFAALLNLSVPGTGYVMVGYYWQAICLQLILIAMTLFTSWTGLIFAPAGAALFLLTVLGLYLASALFLAIQIHRHKPPIKYSSLIIAVVFALSGTGLFYMGFMNKQHWLGLHINFVPSASMQPALEPGDFILVDTWRYQDSAPTMNDVVIFTSSLREGFLVKRIQPWPRGNTLERDGQFYLLGDNRASSTDSRTFGGIGRERIQGQVRLILFSLDKDLSIRPNRWLQAVH